MTKSCIGGYSYPVITSTLYPGAENIAPDTFSRSFYAAVPAGINIPELHNSLCHPEITYMLHFVQTRNLSFSVEEVRQMTKACIVC